MGADLEQWKQCLIKSIQLFCRNFCQYDQEAKIDGLLAITLDQKEVILVKLQEVDNDSSSQRATDGAATEQSELLESILRFLAPSCRLLKKTAIAPTLPSVWQPVSDRTASTEIPSQFQFLRNLGLAPTALVASRKVETSYASRLRTRSSRRMMRNIPPFSCCPPPVSPRLSESAREVNSEPPTLSPCPSQGVLSVSKSECSERSDDSTPLPTLRRCVSDDEKKESVQQSARYEAVRTSEPLTVETVDCNKNSNDLNGVSHHSVLNSKPASLLQMVKSVGCVSSDNVGSSKKSPSCTSKDTDSLCSDAENKKPVDRPKKRGHSNVVSSVESRPKASTSPLGSAVKRVKAEANENVAHSKSDNSASVVRVKADASRSNKKLAKVKENADTCKPKIELNAGNATGRSEKATALVSSKKTSLKSSVKSPLQTDAKNARRKLLNKTKVSRALVSLLFLYLCFCNFALSPFMCHQKIV